MVSFLGLESRLVATALDERAQWGEGSGAP
jgi:hypothetical protein